MIRLTKGAIPRILASQADEWTAAIVDKRARGEQPSIAELTRYRHPDIKTALLGETREKCAYCESKFRHVTFGDIEHIVPKSLAPEKTFAWENLTIACAVCNQKKGVHFGNHDDLVDPYVVEPNDHLRFEGPFIHALPHSTPGLLTETVLDLNRTALMERRKERLQGIMRLVRLLASNTDANVRRVLRVELADRETAPEHEFAAMARSFIERQLALLDAPSNGQPVNAAT